MLELNVSPGAVPELTLGLHDVVINGVLNRNVPIPVVLVEQASDLTSLPDYPAGAIAYTAGFKNLWQLDQSGNWIEV